jgi:hypothetical protein
MVYDPTVGFLWHPLIKAAITSFHVKDGDFSAFGWKD